MNGALFELNEKVDSMAEDLCKVMADTADIPYINQRLRALEENYF